MHAFDSDGRQRARVPRRGVERLDRLRHKAEIRFDRRNRPGRGEYVADPRWDETLHRHLGVSYPCDTAPLDEVLADVERSLAIGGRSAYDCDRTLSRAAWCIVRHLRPSHVVETGVARGVTTRVILEALQRAGHGRLWSIDLPPAREPWRSQVALAVPPALRGRWTYLRGTSRRVLRPLLAQLGRIDLFVHDSLHTEANVRFELTQAWPALAAGGAVLVDDANENRAFARFTSSAGPDLCLLAPQDGKGSLFGVALKRQRER